MLPSGVESSVARIVTLMATRRSLCGREAITTVLNDDIDISRGDLLLAAKRDAGTCAARCDRRGTWMAEQPPLAPGQSYDVKLAGKKPARVSRLFAIQIDINNLTQRLIESLPLNGIGLVEMTFDEPLALDIYPLKIR